MVEPLSAVGQDTSREKSLGDLTSESNDVLNIRGEALEHKNIPASPLWLVK